jgi:aspartate/methionine/tyrosine aminotransferase
MPVYYLFSEKSREQKKHLKETYMESISQYKTYQGSFKDIIHNVTDAEYAPDEAFCMYLTEEYGVTPLPLSCFYYSPGVPIVEMPVVNMIRFFLCKTEETFTDTYFALTGEKYPL